MNETTKAACRLLFECMDELRLHDESPSHVTNSSLKERLQAFLEGQGLGLDTPEKIVEILCEG